ncbi:DUF4157 domain-containing protein [Bizionia paragorgiae]|uniref:eCIS core domain-containing protein n=1 Tax=Bizionia paragorgiae TaxID=283786 RepID=UPI003A8F0F41
MNIHADKTPENKSQSVANAISQSQSGSEFSFQFEDNRSQAVAQKILQEQPIQKKASPKPSRKENNTGLPDMLKSGIEEMSGYSMDDVNVHYNSDKPAQLNAHAYAQGTDIHVASGQEKHLAHEAWHVVQQKQGRVQPTTSFGGAQINDNEGLEKEADVMGAKSLQHDRIQKRRFNIKMFKKDQANLSTKSQNRGVFQRKITDEEVKEKIKAQYRESKVNPMVLTILLEDAFEHTDTYEDAIIRIDRGLKHDEAMFGPPEGMLKEEVKNERPNIDISEDRVRPIFKSSVPYIKTDENELKENWKGSNTKKFYAKLRQMLKIARDTEHENYEETRREIDKLINGYNQYLSIKNLIDRAVRVKAIKAEGASTGTGLDELFKTSETMKYLEFSYRPPEGKSSTAKFNDEEFDWMDAQEQIRLSTEFILWAGDLVEEISGHTGTFQKKYRNQWMTTKQSLMHEVRDDAISKRSNPATAIVEAIGTHLRVTENVKGFTSEEKYKGEEAQSALTTDGYSLDERYDEILEDLEHHRDLLKSYLENFREKVTVSGNSSPLRANFGGDEYHPESPKQFSDEIKIDKELGKVKGNPLYNLALQWRKKHGSPAIIIPPKPINPVITKARNFIKDNWGSKKATSINNAAKRRAKKLNEEADSEEVDKEMISVYIEKLEELETNEELTKIIDELNKELENL